MIVIVRFVCKVKLSAVGGPWGFEILMKDFVIWLAACTGKMKQILRHDWLLTWSR